MSCDGCAGAGNTRDGKRCEECASEIPNQIRLNALAGRYVAAVLEQLGAVAAPVTCHKRSARQWFADYRARSLASAGGYVEDLPSSFVAFPEASCVSGLSSKPTTPAARGPSSTLASVEG